MVIIEYQKNWPVDFAEIENVLKHSLSGLNISVEHIGSTAVPFLAAKPIIDIDIIYNDSTIFERIKERLEKVGYYHNGNQGIIGREVFKRAGILTHEILDTISHHLYVCTVGSVELKRHLDFRNYLRNNEFARIEYQELKYKTAVEANGDRKKYAAIKEVKAKDFIERIISSENLNQVISP